MSSPASPACLTSIAIAVSSPRTCMSIALGDRCPHWKDDSCPSPWISMQPSMSVAVLGITASTSFSATISAESEHNENGYPEEYPRHGGAGSEGFGDPFAQRSTQWGVSGLRPAGDGRDHQTGDRRGASLAFGQSEPGWGGVCARTGDPV